MNVRFASLVASLGLAALMLSPSSQANAACVDGAPDGTWDYRQNEACDTDGGLGCTSECEVESGWVCENPYHDFFPTADGDILHEDYPYSGNDPEWYIDDPAGSLKDSPWGSGEPPFDPYETFQEKSHNSPTLAYSGLDTTHPHIQALDSFQIALSNRKKDENGFMGFALGFDAGDSTNPDAHYLLVDWKRGSARGGNQGIRLSVVDGIPTRADSGHPKSGTSGDFFNKNDGNSNTDSNVHLIAIADDTTEHESDIDGPGHYGNTSWALSAWYAFNIQYTETHLKIGVQEVSVDSNTKEVSLGDEQIIFDLSIEDVQVALGDRYDDIFPQDVFPQGKVFYYGFGNQDPSFTLVSPELRQSTCHVENCGNGTVDAGEDCDGTEDCHAQTCRFLVDITEPSDDVVSNHPFEVEGTGSPGAELIVTIDGVDYLTTVDSDGTWAVELEDGLDAGDYDVTVVQVDEHGGESDAEHSFTVVDRDDVSITKFEGEDLTSSGDLSTLNDSPAIDGEGEPEIDLSYELVDENDVVIDAGTLTTDEDGEWTYTGNNLDAGTYTLKVNDGEYSDDSITFDVHTALIADDVTLPVEQGGSATTDLKDAITEGSSTPDYANIDLDLDNLPAGIHVTIDNGVVEVEIDPAYNGPDSVEIDYLVTDDNSSGSGTITVDITTYVPVVANDDDVDVVKNGETTFNPLDNDTGDLDPETLVVENPDNGTVSVDDNGNVTYTPDPGFAGEDTFTYEVCNSTGLICDGATITVDVEDYDFDPQDDIVNTGEDTPVSIDPSSNDGDDADKDSIEIVDSPNNGELTDNGDGTYTYTPDNDFSGEDSFTYKICSETNPNDCDEATAKITVQEAGFKPRPDELVALEEEPLDIEVDELLANDGADADKDSFALVGQPDEDGLITTEEGGTIGYDDDGKLVYTPADDFTGDDTFVYSVCPKDSDDEDDCEEAEVTVTVEEGVKITDPDKEDEPSFDTPTPDFSGTFEPTTDPDEPREVEVIVDGDPVETIEVDGDGNWNWTPQDPLSPGTHEVCFEGDNGSEDCIEVFIETPWEPTEDTVTTYKDNPVEITEDELLDNDGYDADPDSFKIVDQPENGDLEDNGDGTYTYTPDEGFTGEDSFTYEVCPLGSTDEDDCEVVEVVVDVQEPVTVDEETSDEPIEELTGKGEPGNKVVVVVDGDEDNPYETTVDEDGNWSVTPDEPLKEGTHEIVVEDLDNGSTDKGTVTVEDKGAGDNALVINGPKDGDEFTTEDEITIHGKTVPFSSVKLSIDGEEIGEARSDGKGAWTLQPTDYSFDFEPGEYTIVATGDDDLQDEVTITVVEADDQGGLEGADPDVALTGGRFLSCASTGQGAPSGGLVLLTLGVGLALARRRRDAR